MECFLVKRAGCRRARRDCELQAPSIATRQRAAETPRFGTWIRRPALQGIFLCLLTDRNSDSTYEALFRSPLERPAARIRPRRL